MSVVVVVVAVDQTCSFPTVSCWVSHSIVFAAFVWKFALGSGAFASVEVKTDSKIVST